MRTAKILAAIALTAASALAAPATKVAFTQPHLDTPSDLAKFGQAWPDAPALKPPFLQLEAAPEVQPPADAEAAPDKLNPDFGPDSEEWHCLVPLEGAQRSAVDEGAEPKRCQSPSLEPDKLLHLL